MKYDTLYHREWRKKNHQKFLIQQRKATAKYRISNRLKINARRKIGYRIETGKLVSLPCAFCNTLPTNGHHPDYKKPLDIIWLCKECHSKEHNK